MRGHPAEAQYSVRAGGPSCERRPAEARALGLSLAQEVLMRGECCSAASPLVSSVLSVMVNNLTSLSTSRIPAWFSVLPPPVAKV